MLGNPPRTNIAQLDAMDLRAIVARKLRDPVGATEDGDHIFSPGFADFVLSRTFRPAAVLIPIVERHHALSVVLTKRLDKLRSHSGQVAFPGGKIDVTDVSPQAAALREAQEEIALDPAHAEIIGRLPDYHTGSGYRIAPVLALISPHAELQANPEEVDYVFEVPLAFLMDVANHREGSRMFQGAERRFIEIPFGDHYIWGITAGIIRVMHDRLFL